MARKFNSWRQLQTVLYVAECGSYRAAASALGITSSTVARHIDSISEEIGQPIFLPFENRWELTDVGRELLSIAEKTELSLGIMLQNVENNDGFSGAVRLSTLSFVSSQYLSKSLATWRSENPNAGLSIEETDDARAVERGEADVALRLTRPDSPGISRFKVANCRFGIFTPRGGDPSQWISYAMSLADLPEVQLATTHFGCEPVLRLDSLSAIINASLASGMSCIVPTCLALDHPQLEPVLQDGVHVSVNRELWFLFYETRKNDLAINAARDWVKSVFPSPNACLCGRCSGIEP